jgi:hypothetical protein
MEFKAVSIHSYIHFTEKQTKTQKGQMHFQGHSLVNDRECSLSGKLSLISLKVNISILTLWTYWIQLLNSSPSLPRASLFSYLASAKSESSLFVNFLEKGFLEAMNSSDKFVFVTSFAFGPLISLYDVKKQSY